MLLTITTTHRPATDLGYLLGKHPDRVQTFELAFGKAQVFYSDVSPERCTAALFLDINPIGLVRGNSSFALAEYVNDRPYVASSFLSVAIAQVYRTALNGTCKERPELAASAIPLEAQIGVVPSPHGEETLRRLFEPLGYEMEIQNHPLDEQFPQWGSSRYYTLTLRHTLRLSDLLSHLYVLIPVLDNEKHYYVDDAEVEKLLSKGGDWLKAHPERTLISRRYLKYRPNLVRHAIEQLAEGEEAETVDAKLDAEEAVMEKPLSLHDQRLGAVLAALKNSGAKQVIDLGCGEGRLLKMLLKETQFTKIVGMDVSVLALQNAADSLRLERMPDKKRERIQLLHGSLVYRDSRLAGFDAAAVVEVIEHLDLPRLAAFERVVFQFAQPKLVVITTPNAEYNVKWESLPAGKFRHRDHRFEWTRVEFHNWAQNIAERYGYSVRFLPVGLEDTEVGAPSQMGIFELG
jgi:3' terminal RNA ribose 2'-O-methyltransferase Hen1